MSTKSTWPVFATIMSACVIGILSLHSYQNAMQQEAAVRSRTRTAEPAIASNDAPVLFVIRPILQAEPDLHQAPEQLAVALLVPGISDAISVPAFASETAVLSGENGTAFEIDIDKVSTASRLAANIARTAISSGSFALPMYPIVDAPGTVKTDSIELQARQPQVAPVEKPTKLTSFRKPAKLTMENNPATAIGADFFDIWSSLRVSLGQQLRKSAKLLSPVEQVRSIREAFESLRPATVRIWSEEHTRKDEVEDESDGRNFIELQLDGKLDGLLENSENYIVEYDSPTGSIALVEYVAVLDRAESQHHSFSYLTSTPDYEEYPGDEIVIGDYDASATNAVADEEFDAFPEMEEFSEGDIEIAFDDSRDPSEMSSSHVRLSHSSGQESEPAADQPRRIVRYLQRVKTQLGIHRGTQWEARREARIDARSERASSIR